MEVLEKFDEIEGANKEQHRIRMALVRMQIDVSFRIFDASGLMYLPADEVMDVVNRKVKYYNHKIKVDTKQDIPE